MKKIFSVLLSVLLLTTCLVLPVGVGASGLVENNPDFGTVDYRIDYIRLYQNRYEEIYLY